MDGFGLAVGPRVSLAIDDGGTITIGRGVQFREGCEVWALGGRIAIGTNVFFNRNCSLIARSTIEIGHDCLFGPNVGVYDHDHRFTDSSRPIWQQEHESRAVTIGSDVWIGANAVITTGASIGDHVVIGANSVVTHDLEGGCLYAGAPAKLIRRI